MTLHYAVGMSGTTALEAGTAAIYEANSNKIDKRAFADNFAHNGDPIQTVQCSPGTVGHTNSEAPGGSTTTSLSITTAVCARFLADNIALAIRNQTAIVPANNECFVQPNQGVISNKTIIVENFSFGSTVAAKQCPRASTTACHSVTGSVH